MSEQTFQFDKFMKDIEEKERLQKERRERLTQESEQWSVRDLDQRYREHPHNRITRSWEKDGR